MTIDLSPGAPAKYRQVADDLRGAIERGEVSPGEQLPGESELGDVYGVSRLTIRQALSLLRNEGLVIIEKGKRPTVRPRPQRRRILRPLAHAIHDTPGITRRIIDTG